MPALPCPRKQGGRLNVGVVTQLRLCGSGSFARIGNPIGGRNVGMRRIIGSKSERAGGLARSQTRRDVAEQLERMNADFADCVAETVDRFEGG